MTSEFDSATRVEGLGGGLYAAEIHDRWDIKGNANGGYVLALAARAMRAESGRAHPVSVTMHYLSPAQPGEATVTTSVAKNGRRFAVVTGVLASGGRSIAIASGVFGDVDSSLGPHSITLSAPDLAPFADCVPRQAADPATFGLGTRLDVRIHPDDTGFALDEPTGTALCRGWFAFADGREVDTLSLLLAADALPPVMFNRFGMQGWVPTVEMTVHVRGVPAPGPVACRMTSRVIQGGMWEEDGEFWDSTGQVVALSRQLALAPQV